MRHKFLSKRISAVLMAAVLSMLSLGNNITTLSESCFSDFSSLKYVQLPESQQYLPYRCFTSERRKELQIVP